MMRSFYFALFALIFASSLDQTQGLASIVRNVRKNGIWGRITGHSRSAGFPNVAPQTPQVMESAPLPQSKNIMKDSAGFDADAYRQEMIDLVYQKSMQRSFS